MGKANIFLLTLVGLLAIASSQIQKPAWTAYFPRNETCGRDITSNYDLLSLATDSQGRVWQFSGRRGGCDSLSFLRYFDRTTRNWTTAWTNIDGSGPSVRGDNLMWIDKDDNLYIYGGLNDNVGDDFSDFWKYSIYGNTWTELTVGDGSLNSVERGIPALANYPGKRRGSAYWYTPDDNSLWLFGGVVIGYGSNLGPGLPDLWRFNIDNQQWTFVAGYLEQISDSTVFEDPKDVTPCQRWGALSAVDEHYNLWLFGGEMINDLWMFNRSSGWQHINGNSSVEVLSNYDCQTYPEIIGQFSSDHRPECSAYSSMSYVGNNMLALWSSYTLSESFISLWLYNITSQEWMRFDYDMTSVAEVLYVPDESTSPGLTYYTRVNAPGTLWVVSEDSYGVFSMDLQCWDIVNPCSKDATCTPNFTQMNPTCECNEGLTGDGFVCEPPAAPLNETPTGSNTPGSGNAPNNTPKSSTNSAAQLGVCAGLALVVAGLVM